MFIATLLLNRRESWPWWILAGGLAELTCNALWFRNPVLIASAYFAANALEAAAGAWLLGRFFPRPVRLETLRQVIALLVLGVGLAPMVAATIGATIDALIGKHPFLTAWTFWWIGDATGVLIAAPLVLVLVEAWQDRAQSVPPPVAETAALGLALLIPTLAEMSVGGKVELNYRPDGLYWQLTCPVGAALEHVTLQKAG